jgi:integrase
MARIIAPLSEMKIKKAKPKDKVYKLFDGGGLYLEVKPSGKKTWRIKYRLDNKEKTYTIGEYSIISLLQAREITKEIKNKVLQGIDPVQDRKNKIVKDISDKKTFKDVSEEFLNIKKDEWTLKHLLNQESKLNNYVFEIIGNKSLKDISKSDIVAVLDNVVKKQIFNSKPGDKIALRKKIFLLVRQILRYSIHRDYLDLNVCEKIDINQIIPKKESKHIAAILDEKQFKYMVKALFDLEGVYKVSQLSLKFLILTALRSGNVRRLQWDWIDFKNKIVNIPAEEMKVKKDFRIPLTDTLFDILLQAKEIKKSEFVFYSPAEKNKPLSESIFITMLKRAGIEGHKPHGFRSSFSTFCYEHQKEHGFSSEVIETQLAHSVGNKVTRAYMRSDFLEERRELLKWWEDFLNI